MPVESRNRYSGNPDKHRLALSSRRTHGRPRTRPIAIETGSLLFIENVGNLICPAAVDLGESHKVLSVTEGEDKPLKYPDMFAEADLMLLNKIDLLPYLDLDVGTCIQFALRVNPQIQIINVSARTGEGLPAFCHWIEWRASLMRRPAHASL
jgi:hydrogenase nickel incorporation protein HypB